MKYTKYTIIKMVQIDHNNTQDSIVKKNPSFFQWNQQYFKGSIDIKHSFENDRCINKHHITFV